MTIRAVLVAAAGVAALSLSACNREAETPAAADAMGPEAASTEGMAADSGGQGSGSARSTTASGAASGATGSGSTGGSAPAGGMTGSTGATSGGAVVNSPIPADAPSRNTRETAGAAGSPNQGQETPYAYSPTNPAVQAKK